jgi:hypothetical protein
MPKREAGNIDDFKASSLSNELPVVASYAGLCSVCAAIAFSMLDCHVQA